MFKKKGRPRKPQEQGSITDETYKAYSVVEAKGGLFKFRETVIDKGVVVSVKDSVEDLWSIQMGKVEQALMMGAM